MSNKYRLLSSNDVDARANENNVQAVAGRFVSVVTAAIDDLEVSLRHTLPARNHIQRFSVAEMMTTTLRAMRTREVYVAAGKPTLMDLGYHYTRNMNLASIRHYGLMNKNERINNKINVRENGTAYGRGIYTASNPYAYHGRYGDVCILLARLPGVQRSFPNTEAHTCDSVTVHRGTYDEIVILSSASQCIPILYFDASTIDSNAWVGNTTVDSFHVKLTKALDKSFSNAGVAVPVPLHLRKLPVFSLWAKLEKSRVDETVSYVAPLHIGLAHVQCLWVDYCTSVPEDLTKVKCSVCRHSFRLTKGERLKIVQSFAARNKVHHLACATKREDYIVGKMPSGTMSVRRSSTGQFRESDTGALTGSIVIEYTIPRAVQRFYHPNPGMEHDSTQRTAYLPNTTKGRNLLKRLKYAFRQGLTFTVGVSSTSKKADSVTWASIPHKTSRSGGSRHYGFPDANYLMHCHKQLDALHVPPAHRLP